MPEPDTERRLAVRVLHLRAATHRMSVEASNAAGRRGPHRMVSGALGGGCLTLTQRVPQGHNCHHVHSRHYRVSPTEGSNHVRGAHRARLQAVPYQRRRTAGPPSSPTSPCSSLTTNLATDPTGARLWVNVPMPTPLFFRTDRQFTTHKTNIPDQSRMDQFAREFRGFERGDGPMRHASSTSTYPMTMVPVDRHGESLEILGAHGDHRYDGRTCKEGTHPSLGHQDDSPADDALPQPVRRSGPRTSWMRSGATSRTCGPTP